MKPNVRPATMVIIAKMNAVAIIIRLAMLKLVNVFVTKDGVVMIAPNHALMDTMA